jgi:ATP-dependent Lon protease
LNTSKDFKIDTKLIDELFDPIPKKTLARTICPGIVRSLAAGCGSARPDFIECVIYKSNNESIKFSGESHNKSAVDSVNDAYAYVRSHHKLFNINQELFTKNQLYVKFDGRGGSLGVSTVTAIISIFKNISIPDYITMTGVVDINGDVKAIGSVDEKIKASIVIQAKRVYVPYENKSEVYKLISKEQMKKIKIIFVKNYKEIYEDLFVE